MRNKKSNKAIILISSLLFIVILFGVWQVFNRTRQLSRENGIYQLEKISSEFKDMINEAEKLSLESAVEAREFLFSRSGLEKYIYNRRDELTASGLGVINIYIAGEGWSIVPGMDENEKFNAKERLWYTGAIRNGGIPYVSAPYQDVVTGDICYTVSVMLGDADTVLGIDYTMDTIQDHIAQMYDTDSSEAVIVTDDGIIAGCSDDELVGTMLSQSIPEYVGIWSLSKSMKGVATTRIRSGLLFENLFAADGGNGWYLIISENDWDLYRESYIELMGTLILALTLFFIILFLARRSERRKSEKDDRPKLKAKGVDKRYRAIIVSFMIVVMFTGLGANLLSKREWADARMANFGMRYEHELTDWITTQKSILDMFVSSISTNPNMLLDYEHSIDYLNRITQQYPEISVTYIANPQLMPTVYMNNGWKPEQGWRVEERQWYKDTLASEEGWSISAPYYDEQTGGYCITFSESVFDAKTGRFLGIFGIDFYMDKLIDILGSSYTNDGYAFLVDPSGNIINHPYGSYQMTVDQTTNIFGLPYSEVNANGKDTELIKDYDGYYRILLAESNKVSGFSVYVLSDFRSVYGNLLFYSLIYAVLFMICIVLTYRLLTGMIAWQAEATERMKEASDAAIAADKAKGQFLAHMSHEIRTPINAVLGMNEMIQRESKEGNILEYSDNIQMAGKNLLSLINDVLDFSKIEDGKMEIIPVRYMTASMVASLISSISERAKGKGLELVADINENTPSELWGDEVRIKQIITNILTNAVKYTDNGTVTLRISHEDIPDSDDILLKVSVEDTGIGIKPEEMKKLFAEFERIDVVRNRNIEGSGLGMSITKSLLGMMGSTLNVESEYGKGSTFSFDLRQKVMSRTPVGDYMKTHRDALDRSRGYKVKFTAPDAHVLVVDDSKVNLIVFTKLLKQTKVRIDTSLSADDAIARTRTQHYDVIFMDHMMPEKDGVEALHEIRADEGNLNTETPMVCLTANAISGARDVYIKEGFDDYLTKPIDSSKLEEMLLQYLPQELIEKDTVDTGVSDADNRT
ncbi:MAG: response regulator [Lachnospiraceae bacterium]|nr:response regulator [Lachnospiraceae bacterium]